MGPIRAVADKLYRGPRPESQSDVDGLREYPIVRIVNLQGFVAEVIQVAHEQTWAGAAGIEFLHLPWNLVTPPTGAAIQAAQVAMASPRGAVYVHCHDGVDRTGVACLGYRVARGMTFGAAVGEMIDDGFHLDRYFFWLPVLQSELRKVQLVPLSES
jgi:protein tyrosine phosphatase (PTP) superfamily phosphohydrolase (DUF442 family)